MDASGSRTAKMVAHFRGRAAELYPALLSDPYALRLGGDDGAEAAQGYLSAHPHMVLYMGLRTAAFDDEVRAAIADGAAQVVILGAGLDTRAARLARSGVRFFEVDHPDTQRDKHDRLARLDGYPIDAATYVACDFEKDDFLDRLVAEGFRLDAPAVIVWEGVVYYLTEDAIRHTTKRVATCHRATRLAFDFVGKRFVKGDVKDPIDNRARELVAEMGEPLRFGTDDPLPLLYESGFRHVRSVTFDQLALTYTGTYDRDRKMRFQQLAVASVEPPRRPR
jgi:methyltransferase (TIGR00027 family)